MHAWERGREGEREEEREREIERACVCVCDWRTDQFFSMLDPAADDAYPPTHKNYWNASDSYLMGNVTPGPSVRACADV